MNPTVDSQHLTSEHPGYAFGLVGSPLEHSRSPIIHQAALTALGLPGRYHLFSIPPGESTHGDLKRLMDQVRAGVIHGLNITIPYKQTVIPFMDHLTSTATAIGAVNTVFLEDEKLTGENTDVPGFWFDLVKTLGFDKVKVANVLILGAGGSARAVVFALLKAGFYITIAARRVEQAQEITNQFLGYYERISILDLGLLSNLPRRIDLIVNTTPLGMYPNVNASPWPPAVPLPENARLYDLVYNPVETRLVKVARAEGRKAVGGLGMLVEQAALSFEAWTGISAPREVMLEAAYE